MRRTKNQLKTVLRYGELIEMPPPQLWEYFKAHYKQIASRYDVGEFLAVIDKLAATIVNGYDVPESYLLGGNPNDRNHTWTTNHRKIVKTVSRLTSSGGQFPSVHEISANTGLSRVTVTNHLKELNRGNVADMYQAKYNCLREDILQGLFFTAKMGEDATTKLKSAKLFLDNTKPPNQQNTTNNFIQINNVYIDSKTIAALPEADRKQIEDIILQSNSNSIQID